MTITDIDSLEKELVQRLEELENPHDIIKAPELKMLMASIKEQPKEERATFGRRANELRQKLAARAKDLEAKQATENVEPLDISAPFDVSTNKSIDDRNPSRS